MRSIGGTRQGSASRRQDPWDEDETLEDDEPGPSWTKAYIGGLKVRQYAVTTVADLLAERKPKAA